MTTSSAALPTSSSSLRRRGGGRGRRAGLLFPPPLGRRALWGLQGRRAGLLFPPSLGRPAFRGPRGQVLIEVLLMLPVFLLLVFMVMEIGHLAFRTIILHHAAYEVARVGSLTAFPVAATRTCGQPVLNTGTMNSVRGRILPRSQGTYRAVPHRFDDPQDGCRNFDLVVTLVDDVPMIFPMTGLLLSSNQQVGGVTVGRRRQGRNSRRLEATVRMPIERPLFGARS